jgi:hypothetical protein
MLCDRDNSQQSIRRHRTTREARHGGFGKLEIDATRGAIFSKDPRMIDDVFEVLAD